MKRFQLACCTLIPAGLLGGCNTLDTMVKGFQDMMGISTEISMYNPPNYPLASNIKQITVISGNDSNTTETRTEIEGLLTSIRVNNKPYFTVVEKQDTARIRKLHIDELTEDTFDKNAVAEYGKWVGSDGVYVITNVSDDVANTSFQEERKECTKTEGKKCISWKEFNVSCQQQTAHYSFSPKLVDVKKMNIVYGRTIKSTASDKVCSDSNTALDDPKTLINSARNIAFTEFKRDVAPFFTTEKVMIKDDNLTHPDAERLVENGKAFAKKDRWDRACDDWDKAAEHEPESVSILYNQALCKERGGHLQEAVALYIRAERNSPSPDSRISERLQAAQEKLS